MRTVNGWSLCRESWEEQNKAGRHNPARQVRIWDGPVLTIGAGDMDMIDVFEEQGLYFVVSVNHGLEYAGLEVFDSAGDEVDGGSVFLQYDFEVRKVLGPRGVDLSPMAIAKRLSVHAGL